MNNIRIPFFIILLLIFSAATAPSQDVPAPTKHFDKGGIAFDYPAQWTLTENKSPGMQIVTVSPGPPTQVVVSRYVGPISSCDLVEEGRNIEEALTKKLTNLINAGAGPGSTVTTETGVSEIKGTEYRGFIDQQPAVGALFSQHLTGQFLSLAFVRRVDDSSASSAWDTVRNSLKVEQIVLGTLAASPHTPGAPISGGVVNGRAISLPRPGYPPVARSAHASGTVAVQVTIDESGAVIAAHAVSGHPLLQAACVAAAKEARFSPTKLCGEAVKVTGIITYNFVAR